MPQSPIFARTEAFMVWLLKHTAKFPRHERFRLAGRIDDMLSEFHAHLVDAARGVEALPHLQAADRALFLLRTYLRLSLEMGYTADNQYRYAAEKMDEIGRLLGGWLKKVDPPERSTGSTEG